MKIHIYQPPETKSFVEFSPSLGLIKKDQTQFQIWVKLLTKQNILKVCHKFAKGYFVKIPFSLIAAEQKLSVDFEIQFKLTTHLLKFFPNKIEFGNIFYSKNENPEKFETEE